MKTNRLLNLFLLMLLAISQISYAQDFIGFRESNYSGVSGADLNPAFLADNRMVVDVTLGGASFTGYNNHIYFNPHQMPFWWTGTFKTDENGNYGSPQAQAYATSSDWDKIISADSTNYYKSRGEGILFEFGNPKGLPRMAYYNHSIEVLNFMVTINPKMAFSMGIKNRTFLNVDHLSPELLTLAQNGLDYPSLWNINLSDQLLNVSFNSWNEYQLGFGMVLMDKNEHFLKGGIKVKFLQGLGSAYIYTDEVNYEFLNADTAVNIQGHFNYGYSSNMEDLTLTTGSGFNTQIDFSNFTTSVSKLGLGLDLGIVYEWRPKWQEYKYDMDGETDLWRKDKNKYAIRAAFAINDIGGMRYEKGGESRDFRVNINSIFALAQLEDTDGLVSFNRNIDTLVQDGYAEYTETNANPTYFMNLPTHMTANVDFHIWNHFYLNTNAFIGLQMNKNANKVRYPTSFALTPRWDYAWAGVSLPVSYSGLTGLRTGLGLRMGPVIVGVGDMKPLFVVEKDKQIRGVDFYFALKVPILQSHPKDRDGDKVSDKLDICIDTPGVWAFKGCPDTDMDGIQDSEDDCPTEAGLKEFNGCPDRDGDGVMDRLDDCPDDAGLKQFNGCPDTDGDGIIDKEDDCPNEAGIPAFKGCPDTDGDGIKDSDDLCPNDPGPIENDGCPDTDGDGIFDYLDECPTQAGPVENKGCPWPDTDGDGVLDKDDDCPLNPGPAKNNGCPYADTDGDGVLDKDDECPNVPGPVENKGCPEIQQEEQEIINTAFENLEFETGKAIIKQSSYESLEALAELLIRKPEWRIKVAGHTDNQGSAQGNLVLSKKRAEALRDFLVSRGVTTDRVIVQYYGQERPIADNSTPEGRQRNRRVEMEIIFEK